MVDRYVRSSRISKPNWSFNLVIEILMVDRRVIMRILLFHKEVSIS